MANHCGKAMLRMWQVRWHLVAKLSNPVRVAWGTQMALGRALLQRTSHHPIHRPFAGDMRRDAIEQDLRHREAGGQRGAALMRLQEYVGQ